MDIELDRMDDNSGDENPYKELIINNAYRVENVFFFTNGAVVNP